MRRRLDLASTLVSRPEILFLDEPTTGLDPRARNELWAVLDTLVDSGATLLLTTQYLEEAERLADDILVVDHGRVIASGNARTLKRQVGGDHIGVTMARDDQLDAVAELLARVTGETPVVDASLRSVTVPTTTGVAGLGEVANALADAGMAVEDLGLRQPTLDEVFLTLTGNPIDHGDGDRDGPADTERNADLQEASR
jgi:ABC-2 type transport system ATP-binding protein